MREYRAKRKAQDKPDKWDMLVQVAADLSSGVSPTKVARKHSLGKEEFKSALKAIKSIRDFHLGNLVPRLRKQKP